MSRKDIARARWHKSTRSGEHNCVEVAANLPTVLVRDIKSLDEGDVLGFSRAAWRGFLAGAKAGEFGLR